MGPNLEVFVSNAGSTTDPVYGPNFDSIPFQLPVLGHATGAGLRERNGIC